MKKALYAFLLTGLFSFSTQAAQGWERELENYGNAVQDYSQVHLLLNVAGYSTMMVGTCGVSALAVAASAIADTYPATNFIAEGLANLSHSGYETLDAEAFFSLRTLANTGRGTLGGAAVATLESFEFIVLWLAGREAEGFQATQTVYESTLRTAQALYSPEGKCLQSFAKLYITIGELEYRFQQNMDDSKRFMDEDWIMP
ncbi:MAG: hypothetical protein KDD40_08320 [Bdellovibrionales bacterium]|nr:hypothetical protein [Bdellovibrionales bacterium]